ncbi:hydroperoxide isomerase ALOXE3-like [Archocentrus centrarchus]|uniref:hydroperoxide isomerase ALOXE3-like n=1 Tax=Archocentrus centrarchus TaxID=63155 RepID=UPI0011EA0FA3|nr:hydroperoxide isomerase ALOXE3-like [Archocentrus centrarchus]
MVDYEVTLFTGDLAFASTFDDIYIKLVGSGESQRTLLPRSWIPSLFKGGVSKCTISCPKSLGKLVLIELQKETMFFNDSWYPAKVDVKSPEGDTYHFPIYHWITDSELHYFREGAALLVFEDKCSVDGYSREQEIKQQQEVYCWGVYEEGIPHCIKADSLQSLPDDIRFSLSKTAELAYTAATGLIELELIGISECTENFTCVENIDRLLCVHQSKTSEYVRQHWKEDDFFGYQYLNGTNPILIRRCEALPDKFPVTNKMVFPDGKHRLADEMKKGNIFLCDYKLLDGVPTNTINGKKQYLTAPLVLLWKTGDKMKPVAIQLKQKPAKDNPVFLPTDSEYDWLMAKIYVRSADFNLFELNTHLLRTHLLAEVFAMSVLRNLPMVHPLYKLLIPHTHYTLNINFLARTRLISRTGVFTKFTASGGEGVFTILKKSLSSLTYSSLCIPEDITERGLKDVPNFYYRDDGLKLWEIIHRFVRGILSFYYKTDAEVQQDSELQSWIQDIFKYGFLSKESTGIPQKFSTVDEMVKFVTVVIFISSAQHSAVNSGQYDFGAWMPNSPTTMQLPPPTKKGTANEKTMLESFPSVDITVNGMAVMWLLSKQSSDHVLIGQYPEEHFSEEEPLQKIRAFQEELQKLSAEIKARNEKVPLPYTYMDPDVVENSVSL